jgi:hypothetical protein
MGLILNPLPKVFGNTAKAKLVFHAVTPAVTLWDTMISRYQEFPHRQQLRAGAAGNCW